MFELDKCFLDVYTPPELATVNHKCVELGKVDKYLKSLQKIQLTQEEMSTLVEDKTFWCYESDTEIYNKLESMDEMFEDSEFENLESGYGVSEYIGVHEKYLPSIEYLQYSIMNNSDVIMNIYDAYNLYDISRRNEIIRNKVAGHMLLTHNFDSYQEIPKFEFKVPDVVKYTKFTESKFESDIFISCFQDPVHILSVNIPYEYYAYQPLPPNVYNWNVETKEHTFGPMNETKFNDMLLDICTNGITKPLFMRMNGEILSSVNDETIITLFIAKLLKLPSIPVNIYLSNEWIGINHMIDFITSRNYKSPYKSINFMNKVLEPYVVINRPDEVINIKNINNYTLFSSNDNVLVRYLKDADSLDNNDYEEINIHHNEMKNNTVKTLNDNIDKIIEKLMSKD